MTAPTYDDEQRLRHFAKSKPHHTGLHLSPAQIRAATHDAWWFATEDAVERYEHAYHRMFCRACPADGKHGKHYTPLLVDYQRNPLGDKPQVLATTHCPNCGEGEMYPIDKLHWDIGDPVVTSAMFPADTADEHRKMDELLRHLAVVSQLGMQGAQLQRTKTQV